MGTRVLVKSEWEVFFLQLHKQVEGKEMRIEVMGPTIGDQVLVDSAHLLGATYEPKQESLEILTNGMTHVVDKPQKISVEENEGEIFAIDVIDGAERHQLMTFA
ncbi:hypothetical protein ATY81_00570 [Rhizobium sp. R72]|uniref:DUF5335 family protein n=1 Tax=unclassified Rhizobium TaxID=2613769 RepID=UPI000B52C6FE|nr:MULTISPECIES: DUF5335 family protein [unclassified Rhizobium]OWW04523.1 hypothetical protein ATY81_00570 [Rhizobium sp. R72]OWW05580.1 hypothetical protein ATY80_00570 [Rhizobium sp. R711]